MSSTQRPLEGDIVAVKRLYTPVSNMAPICQTIDDADWLRLSRHTQVRPCHRVYDVTNTMDMHYEDIDKILGIPHWSSWHSITGKITVVNDGS